MPLSLFYSYSHKDERYREILESHLAILKRQGYISAWHDRRIAPGDNWEEEIDLNLDRADIILLLISSDFLASDYCYETETIRALEKSNKNEAKVIPIILKPCLWEESHFARLQALPKDGKAITTWPNEDEAWYDVAKGILKLVKPIDTGKVKPESDVLAIKEAGSIQAPQKESIENLVISFLKSFNQWYFSPLRIVKWGGRQEGFKDLNNYKVDEIKKILSKLKDEGKVKIILSQKGNTIYKLK